MNLFVTVGVPKGKKPEDYEEELNQRLATMLRLEDAGVELLDMEDGGDDDEEDKGKDKKKKSKKDGDNKKGKKEEDDDGGGGGGGDDDGGVVSPYSGIEVWRFFHHSLNLGH